MITIDEERMVGLQSITFGPESASQDESILITYKDSTCLKNIESHSLSEWRERRNKETVGKSEVMIDK